MRSITTNDIIKLKTEISMRMINNNESLINLDANLNSHLDYIIRINALDKIKIVCSISKSYEIVRVSMNPNYAQIVRSLQSELNMNLYNVE